MELDAWQSKVRQKGVSIGFVPTMGALHEGHLSLVRESTEENDYTLVSIFVNPKQFNNSSDFETYPVNHPSDVSLLESTLCDAVFIPSYDEIYPQKRKAVKLDMGSLNNVLEGPVRPGHFDGVIQVVYRLFDLIKPNVAYFGLKDFQQCMVIKMLRNEYFPKLRLKFCPTQREGNGLAMSSRNTRLNEAGRKKASKIFEVLNTVRKLHEHIEAPDAIKYGKHLLQEAGIKVEYLALANADTLNLVNKWQKTNKNILLAAVFVDDVRLIDNLIF